MTNPVVLPGVRGGVRGLHGDHVRVAGPGRARAARGQAAVGAAGRRRGGQEVTLYYIIYYYIIV